MSKTTNGAFGGHYNHSVIKELRKELAMKNIIIAALVQHTKIPQEELSAITSKFISQTHAEMAKSG